MKAIRFHSLGAPDVLQLDDVPTPVPAEGEVLLLVRAVGVNYADTRFRRDEYFIHPVLPQIPGMEAAGEVVALGPGVQGVKLGDRVMSVAMNAYAEFLVCKPHSLYPMPAGLDFPEAAALPIQGMTAHHLLGLTGRFKAGESVLVHAAAGGVGTLAVQLAKQLGAGQIIATAGSAEKLELARSLGADVLINYRDADLLKGVRRATGGVGVDLLLEMLGGQEVLEQNLRCLAPFGRMVVYGAASGDTSATLQATRLMTKNTAVLGYYLTPILRHRELCAPALASIAKDVVEKRVKVIIGEQAPLKDAARIHAQMEGRATTGKLVLIP